MTPPLSIQNSTPTNPLPLSYAHKTAWKKSPRWRSASPSWFLTPSGPCRCVLVYLCECVCCWVVDAGWVMIFSLLVNVRVFGRHGRLVGARFPAYRGITLTHAHLHAYLLIFPLHVRP